MRQLRAGVGAQIVDERRHERLRRRWIASIASACALLIALGLMALADGGTALSRRPATVKLAALSIRSIDSFMRCAASTLR